MAHVSQEKKAQLAPAIKAVLNKYKMKASISVRHHSSLVVTIKSGAIDFGRDHIQVNEYWINEHYTGTARKFLTELLQAMKGPDYFNDDDSQTDYFHRSHYTDINVGRWDKPYVFTGISADGTVNGVPVEDYTFA
jgi:hypothetical protein